ncbi:hypothetical protein FACS1894214_4450 [Planctomycetales bacterium]|nr:hypothetical protein FACS1894214_4450 [Planctomycetales bacterium]
MSRYQINVEVAPITRIPSNGATRARFYARENINFADSGLDADWVPAPIFLCCIEPPDAFTKTMRESFVTITSVEDLAEYPWGVSSIEEVPPEDYVADTLLYAAQENKTYIRSEDEDGAAVWVRYIPPTDGLAITHHVHRIPFFRRTVIDIILPNRSWVIDAIDWLQNAANTLEKDQKDIEILLDYIP